MGEPTFEFIIQHNTANGSSQSASEKITATRLESYYDVLPYVLQSEVDQPINSATAADRAVH
jgi:hypothetical protein